MRSPAEKPGCAPSYTRRRGAIAQLEERLDRTQEVAGSSPASSIRKTTRTFTDPGAWPGGRTMKNGWNSVSRRAGRRLLVGIALGAAVFLGTAAPASAATTATFSSGILTVTGDSASNSITLSRDAAGRILVNGGAIPVTGGRRPWPTHHGPGLRARRRRHDHAQRGQRGAAAGAPVRRRQQRHAYRRLGRTTCSTARAATTRARQGRLRHAVRRQRATTRSPAAMPTTRSSARPATTG